ncbi:MAG: histidine kinase [Bacteroidota bacterium]
MKLDWNLIIKSLALAILLLISIVGMAKFKAQWERTQSWEAEIYFWAFEILFWAVLSYSVLSWIFKKWAEYKQLKNEHNAAMLASLKSKIDPHFFFNTLNNLYGLAVEQSPKTPEAILKLSDVMRYTIYKGEQASVALEEEVAYLRKYIEIHKIRHHKELDINFEVDIENEQQTISPLLLIMLLENAFKHGAERLRKGAFIHIKLHQRGNKFKFLIKNNFDPESKQKKGLGLSNLEKRLKLIYPKRHQLQLERKENIFIATLEIDLQ